jgi:hypothetical protein
MTAHYIDLFPHEAKALSEKRLGLIIRVVEPQPPEDMAASSIHGPEFYHQTIVDDDGEEDAGPMVFGVYDKFGEWGCESPFTPGEVLVCREEWHPAGRMANEVLVEYKADESERIITVLFEVITPELDAMIINNGWEWQNSQPDWAIRFHVKVDGVRCKQAQDVTEEEWRAWCPPDVIQKPWPIVADYHPNEAAMHLFESIHGAGSWEANPWVWVLNISTVS